MQCGGNVMGIAPIRVLLADDDVDFCLIQRLRINAQKDMDCIGMARDGKEAVDMIYAQKPDVVLLDHFMPGMDGLSVLEYLQKNPVGHPMRIIVSSVTGQPHIMREIMRCGADYYLEKPFEGDTLIRRIRFVYELDRENQEAQRWNLSPWVERTVAQEVLSLGISPKRIGYRYIKEAVCAFLDPAYEHTSFKEVYNLIAIRCNSEAHCIENAISSVIKSAEEQRTSALEELLGMLPSQVRDASLSNGTFISLIVQKIKIIKM